ncbi:MAG: 2OG-Fe(II) oxygenase, partial [Pseudomonadota bacterium]
MDPCETIGSDIAARIEAVDWSAVNGELDDFGVGRLGPILTRDECKSLKALYAEPSLFRSRIVMARHGFGQGEYQYFAYPLPGLIKALREAVYPSAARTANRWAGMMGTDKRYPEQLEKMLERCHAAGQKRPTPLMLKYGPGDYN